MTHLEPGMSKHCPWDMTAVVITFMMGAGCYLHRGSRPQRLRWERSPPPVTHGHSATRVGIWQALHSKALTGQES